MNTGTIEQLTDTERTLVKLGLELARGHYEMEAFSSELTKAQQFEAENKCCDIDVLLEKLGL